MEAFSLVRPPTRHKAMGDVHMDLHTQTPQQNVLPQSTPLAPERRFLPDSNHEATRKVKRGEIDEERKVEYEDEELLFNIDEFLVEEEEALFRGTDGNENDIAAIIAQSPTNSDSYSDNPSTETHQECPIPDVASTNTSITNIRNNNAPRSVDSSSRNNNSSTTIHKKKRKRKSRNKSKFDSSDKLAPPKRPLSAYNLYFREERKRCIAEASSNSAKKYNFEELGKLIGKGWRSLPLKEKRELEARAEADRERYRNEMIAYRSEKRRRAREEDQDSLILMQRHHSGHLTPCPHSPRAQRQYPYQQYVTVSPGQPREHPSVQHRYSPNADTTQKNHIRKVSVSISSPPHATGSTKSTEYRSTNNSSPALSSYGSCSSWSGDERGDDSEHQHRRRKPRYNTQHDGSKSRETLPNQILGDPSKSSGTRPSNGITPGTSPKSPARTPPPRVPVARVVAMPATDGLQRMLQDGQATRSPPPPQPPHAWMAWGHAPSSHRFHHDPPPLPQPYAAPSQSSKEVHVPDRHRYSPPPSLPPPQPTFLVAPPPVHHGQKAPQPVPQMLPLGMSILLRDPATGQERSYRIQYAPQFMTAEQATRFHRAHGGGIGVNEVEPEPSKGMV